MFSLQEFAVHLSNNGRSQVTISGYQKDIIQFLYWYKQTKMEEFLINEVTPADISDYLQYMATTKYCRASTIQHHLSSLSALMVWAIKAGLIDKDPTSQVRIPPRKIIEAPKYLDKKQQQSIKKAIEEDLRLSRIRYPKRWRSRQRDAALVIFMMQTGLRLQEVVALQISDLHLNEKKGFVLIRQGRGCQQRQIPLNSDARKAVEDWLNVRPEVDNDYVWVADSESGPLTGRSILRVIQRIGQDAGLFDLTAHIFRGTFAKNLADNGVSVYQVAALLGIKNLNALRPYFVFDQSDLELATEGLTKKNSSSINKSK